MHQWFVLHALLGILTKQEFDLKHSAMLFWHGVNSKKELQSYQSINQR